MEREKLGSNKIKYNADVLRHMNLYNILNNGVKADIVYDTSNNFMDIRQIENILKRNSKMKQEIKFKTDDYNYYNRAVGIIKHNDKFLIMNVNNAPYYHIPGGYIEIGEDSLSAVAREIKEELGYTVKNATLFCIQENFYKKRGIVQHGVEYYYIIEPEEDIKTVDKEVAEIDRGEEKHLFIKWVSIDELKEIDLRPFTVKDLMVNNKLGTLTHIIKKD